MPVPMLQADADAIRSLLLKALPQQGERAVVASLSWQFVLVIGVDRAVQDRVHGRLVVMFHPLSFAGRTTGGSVQAVSGGLILDAWRQLACVPRT